VAEPSGNPPGPPHACRTRTLRMPAKTPLAVDKINAPSACAVLFRPYCGGVVTRNVSEYMLVLALCLVNYVMLQTDNHAGSSPLSFCRPDAVPDAQPTVSKNSVKRHG